MRKILATFIFCLLIPISVCLSATSPLSNLSSGKGPIVILSRELTYDKQKHLALYVGDVLVERNDLKIQGDKLLIYFDKTGKRLEKVIMLGNVRFWSKNGSGSCQKLIYLPSEAKAILEGKAVLKRDSNVVSGDRITVFPDGSVLVEGIKSLVKTVIVPEELKSGRTQHIKSGKPKKTLRTENGS